MNWKVWSVFSLILLTLLLVGLFAGCDDGKKECPCDCSDDDDDEDDDDGDDDDVAPDDDDAADDDDDWYDPEATALENCVAFHKSYHECFSTEGDDEYFEALCTDFADWETLFEGNYCMAAALNELWLCLDELLCSDYATFEEYQTAVEGCMTPYLDMLPLCDDNDPPVIADADWDPDNVEYDATEDHWISHIMFTVCDVENNLLGGAIYVYQAGTTNLIWANAVEWSAFTNLPDASDCDNPLQIQLGTIFAEGADPPGRDEYFCTDMEVTDGELEKSNMLSNFCVYIP